MKKRFLQFSFIAVSALFITMVSLQGISLTASTDGEIDGELTSSNYNNRASVTDFDLLNATGSSIGAGGSIDPSTNVTAQITIEDPDSLDDLNSVEFFFHYDTTSTPSTPGALSLVNTIQTDDSGDQFVVLWTRDSGTATIQGSSGTWALVNSTVPAVYTGTSFVFELQFTISKVAPFTSGDEWYFGTEIIDGRVSLDSGTEPNPIFDEGLVVGTGSSITVPPSGFDMNFYGEVDLSSATSNVSWSGVRAGDDFNSASSSALISDIKYISNANYHTNIKSSEIWEAVITQEIVNDVLSGSAVDGDTDAITAFVDQYNSTFTSKPDLSGSTIDSLIGVTYGDANTVINAVAATWAGIEFLLPQPSVGANLTGASLVTTSGVIDTEGFTEQFFMIGYDEDNLSSQVLVDSKAILASGNDWREFYPDGLDSQQDRTDEDGDLESLTLYLRLSSVFQNAQYSGTISLQITNTAPE